MATKKKGGKNGRKIGRNKATCEKYRAEGRKEKNRLRRARKHLRQHPGDQAAREALN